MRWCSVYVLVKAFSGLVRGAGSEVRRKNVSSVVAKQRRQGYRYNVNGQVGCFPKAKGADDGKTGCYRLAIKGTEKNVSGSGCPGHRLNGIPGETG